MHVFGIVLEDGEEGFFEDEHPRYLFLYEGLLSEVAEKLSVPALKSFDGFSKAEEIANENADSNDTIAWLSAYNDARDSCEPVWFDASEALGAVMPIKESIQQSLDESPDDNIEYLIESLEVLIEILASANERKSKFCMALM
ncbi:hypothetical protein SAMN05216271_3286 [Halopseudomonas sabulinigri]|uniref:Uncharacterized protein n=1 Tax=Halopseudomonas sabulinigri TaxID=472181 RepID=A0A1H1WQI9_9GAMM|nr:hypothetical protein [Halopseudomonas sabulinigri]SDS98901.1 hypothetical protein SAMN05216271_3286 [Halopseudomonas sabulinigri]